MLNVTENLGNMKLKDILIEFSIQDIICKNEKSNVKLKG